MNKRDTFFMRQALALAEKGRGRTKTNPLVGAIVVRSVRIVGQGYHAYFGGPHAEVVALRQAGRKARGATLYVTLEPCAMVGKTPPCTYAIAGMGITRVVIGVRDPNPQNRGHGMRFLQRAGIKISCGILAPEIKKQNAFFFTVMQKKRPFVILKMAQSLDGKIATRTRASRWITGNVARRSVHDLRSRVDAIAVGSGTVMADDPRLTVRHVRSRKNPSRVILDAQATLPVTKKVFTNAQRDTVILVVGNTVPKARLQTYINKGVTVIRAPLKKGRININAALRALVKYNIGTVMVEGGSTVAASFLEAKVVDSILFFTAPMIIGGREAPTSVAGTGARTIAQAVQLKNVTCRKIGADYLFCAEPKY